jgi:hypothetical protein
MIRTANIEVSLQRLSILRIEHPQANPLTLACTLRAGESLPSGLMVTAEIHTSRNVAAETAPLASTTVSVGAGALTFDVDFTSAQLNQTVTPNSTRALWLVVYGVGDADQLYTLSAADLLLGWHAISTLTADPPATSILLEKGGVAWATGRTYASGTVVTVGTTAYVASSSHTSGSTTQPGTGASWETVWAVLSGGGGGTVNLTMARTANAVTITPSGGGTAAEIPQANNTNAGVLTAAHHQTIQNLGTISTQSAANVAITGGAITGTTVSGITLTNGGSGALTVTGTASIAGTSSGTNTGDQTITLTGDVTGSGTGSFAATIAAGAVTYAKMQAVSAASRLIGRGTAGTTAVREIVLGVGLSMASDTLSVATAGSNTIIRFFPKDNEPPASGFATIDTRNSHPVLDFPASGSPTAIFRQYVPAGVVFASSGTAITVYIDAAATSATSGVIGWSVSLERLVAGGQDLDSADNFGTAQSGSGTINATSGIMTRVAVTFTQAQLPTSLAAGDMFRLRVVRNTAVGSNHTGDAELVGIFADFTPGTGA